MLTHTTAWDRLWGGDVFLRLYIQLAAKVHERFAFYGVIYGYFDLQKIPLKNLPSNKAFAQLSEIIRPLSEKKLGQIGPRVSNL